MKVGKGHFGEEGGQTDQAWEGNGTGYDSTDQILTHGPSLTSIMWDTQICAHKTRGVDMG